MSFLIILWLILFTLSLGVAGLIFISMKRAASKPWRIKIGESYKPKVSLLIPTYNESSCIRFKLENLNKINYPKELMQVMVVDSNSSDHTIDSVNEFIKLHPNLNFQLILDNERKGKSAALNLALKYCTGDVIVVSDADCFWSPDILCKALPFLADSNVGAVSGSKNLLNPQQSWVTRTEDAYLRSMNLMKLGESKLYSTLLFEGGFSAYKKEFLESFDPYNTGSDDCGTIVKLTEKGARAILIPEATFFTTFPATWREKMNIKTRRAGQLVRVFLAYAWLLARKRVKRDRRVIVQDLFLYLVSPAAFVLLLATTIFLLLDFPYFALLLLVLLIPRLRSNLIEFAQNCIAILVGIVYLALNKRFTIWSKPKDRILLTENMLHDHGLI